MATQIRGKVWRFGANISTDDIISGIHLSRLDASDLTKFAFQNLRPEFARQVRRNDIIVAEKHFGIGSSREEAPAVLQALGIGVIVAASFARIFYRNAFNIGLPAIEFPAIADSPDLIEDGDIVTVNLSKGTLENHRTKQTYPVTKIPDFLMQYIKAGGALPLLKQKLTTS
ncbi:MAG: 3-isopropylmalate dehydratase [Candidatus Hermodarchaeota archaeon]|nr:3-isopropylmalate dehydratase [Candidatus Hermodarchaeota archaeon]